MIRNDAPADELASNSNWLTVAIIFLAILSCFVLLAILMLNPRTPRSPPYAYAGYDFGRGGHVHYHNPYYHYHENFEDNEQEEFEIQSGFEGGGDGKGGGGAELATITLPLENTSAVEVMMSSTLEVTNSSSVSEDDGVCRSHGCVEAGRWLAESLDFTQGPCEDFYSFVCGGWKARTRLWPDQATISPFTVLEDQVSLGVKSLLEGHLKEETEPRSVLIAQQLYQECVHQDKNKSVLALKGKLAQLLNLENGSTWPLVRHIEEPYSFISSRTFILTYLRFSELQISPIIDFGVEVDANATRHKLVHFRAPTFGLPRYVWADPKRHNLTIGAYRRYLHDLLKRFTMDEADYPVDEVLEIDIEFRVNELLAFESQLAMFTQPAEDEDGNPLNLPSTWYNRMTLAEFKNLTENYIDWTLLLRLHIGSVDITDLPSDLNTTVIVKDIGYYQQIAPLIEKTPLHLLYNYLGVRFLDALAPTFADGHLVAITSQYLQRRTEVARLRPLWRRCVDETARLLPLPLSRLYVGSQLPKIEKRKEAAHRLIAELRLALREYLGDPQGSGSFWLDAESRMEALKKAEATSYNVGYPKWLFNGSVNLDHRVGLNKDGISIESGNYLESVLSVRRFRTAKEIRDLGRVRSASNDLKMPPIEVNDAAALLLINTVSLPAAMLQAPFFATDRPPTLNFGALGGLLAHQMTHHLDRRGAEHRSAKEEENDDKESDDKQHHHHHPNTFLQRWWTEETMSRWAEAADCFRAQYGSIEDPETGMMLNANRTLGEDIADSGAIRLAWYAWWHRANSRRPHPQPEPSRRPLKLPQMEAFTDEQLFFISYAKNFCSNSRPAVLLDHAHGASSYSPDRYRVNLPLANFEQFGRAFHCTAGTPMNPLEKCRLW